MPSVGVKISQTLHFFASPNLHFVSPPMFYFIRLRIHSIYYAEYDRWPRRWSTISRYSARLNIGYSSREAYRGRRENYIIIKQQTHHCFSLKVCRQWWSKVSIQLCLHGSEVNKMSLRITGDEYRSVALRCDKALFFEFQTRYTPSLWLKDKRWKRWMFVLHYIYTTFMGCHAIRPFRTRKLVTNRFDLQAMTKENS